MKAEELSIKYSPVYWLVLIASAAAFTLPFVPLEVLIQAGNRILPFGTVMNKTILLFQALKIAVPTLAGIAIAWLLAPYDVRRRLANTIDEITHSTWIIPAILGLTLVLCVGWIFYYPTQLYADSQWYFNLATWLAAGRGYIYDTANHKPTAAWPVGYPMFLASIFLVTGPSMLAAKLANVVLVSLIVYTIYLVAQRIFDRTVAVFAALFMTILPGFIVYSNIVCSDLLFLALIMCVLNMTLRNERLRPPFGKKVLLFGLFTGLLYGFMSLTRATGLPLFPILIVVLWMVDRRRTDFLKGWSLAFGIGVAFVVLPWTTRNYYYFHKLIPISTNGGTNLWQGNNPLAYGGWMFPRDRAQNPLVPLIGNEFAVNETGTRLALQFIRENPGRALRILPAKVFYLYNSSDKGVGWNTRSRLSPDQQGAGDYMHAFANLVYTCVALVALIGLAVLAINRKTVRPLVWIGVIFGLYWTLLHLPFVGEDRYAVPTLPFLAIYAAYGLSSVLHLDRAGLALE